MPFILSSPLEQADPGYVCLVFLVGWKQTTFSPEPTLLLLVCYRRNNRPEMESLGPTRVNRGFIRLSATPGNVSFNQSICNEMISASEVKSLLQDVALLNMPLTTPQSHRSPAEASSKMAGLLFLLNEGCYNPEARPWHP
ncbi:hypothetical protein VULLAG_LOCUS30 [Vulpes lagopus]